MLLKEPIRIAILDLYEGTTNEGMRCIREIVEKFEIDIQVPVQYTVYDVRAKSELPGITYDVYISSGGPGDPAESEGSLWEQLYFSLMERIKTFNKENPVKKKYVFLICHSFQIFCRYYGFGVLSKRKSPSFGVMPGHKTEEGQHDPMLGPLADPFWIVDSREYQITQPDEGGIQGGGGAVVCLEKIRTHIDLERAVMAIRFDDTIFGTQFHPEADAASMRMYLLRDDKKAEVIEKHGEQKYWQMLNHLDDPDKIMLTHDTIIPRFLMRAVHHKISSVSV